MGILEFDFGRTMRQVHQLEDIAEELKKISDKKIGSAMRDLSHGWKGENASAFQAKAGKVQKNIYTTAGELDEVAGTIKRVAQRVYTAEVRAKEMAEARNYKG